MVSSNRKKLIQYLLVCASASAGDDNQPPRAKKFTYAGCISCYVAVSLSMRKAHFTYVYNFDFV